MVQASPVISQQSKPVVSCESLAKVALPNTTVTMAQPVAAGALDVSVPNALGFPPTDIHKLPALCRVTATLTPSPDSDIEIEVWLPLAGWNGKFAAWGNLEFGGIIHYQGMVAMLAAGYATATTDTGHVGNTGAFLVGHPEKFVDYAYRAAHEMTLKSKALVKAFYGVDPIYSYWVGCSLGGLEALIEAKRYPEDYDGIIAGAPVNPLTRFNAEQIWMAWVINKNPEKAITPSKAKMLHEAVLKACATPIGLKQGFIDYPESCHFDPGTLLCKNGYAPDCLTAPQVEAVRQYYAGPVNPRTGESIFPGPPPGNESPLINASNGATRVAVELYKYAVHQDPDWDWKTMDFDKDVESAKRIVDPSMLVDPNLNGFLNRGGKLLIHIGWTEGHNPSDLEAFVRDVMKNAGPNKEDSVRLFEMPGMNHCLGGAGCDTFDKLGTIDAWVSQGKTPERIVASKLENGKTIRTRPICAYPLVSRYKGTGSETDASSYVCAK